jgi:MFS family permease
MGVSSLGTALLPPYASIGLLALFILFFFRFLLGIGLGGEAGGAWSWIAEARPNSKHRGFWISWPTAVLTLGKLLSVFAFYIAASSLSNAAYFDWGWRVPFAVGALMVVVALIVRIKIMESPMFQKLAAKRSVLKYPAFQVIREQGRKIFTLLWLQVYIVATGSMVILPYSVSYLVRLGVSDAFANLSVSAGTAVAFFALLGGSYLSDHMGRLKVLRLGATLTIVMLFPYFFLLNTANPIWILVGQVLLYSCSELAEGTNAATFTESFATKYRYSGAGLCYQLAGFVVGVLIALIIPAIIMTYGVLGAWQMIVWIAIALCIVSIAASFVAKETRGITLE